MKSPQVLTVVIAAIFAVVAFVISGSVEVVSPTIVAALVFVSAFVSPLLGKDSGDSADNNDSSDDVRTLYVGNLPYRANESAVRELFSQYGSVHSVRLMKDKHTGKRRGFGFVEMSANDLDGAISALNDTEFQQRTLKVREAKERPERTDSNE